MLQQEFPNWDSLRIMSSRADHLDWMHRHFATRVVAGSELLAEVDSEGTNEGIDEGGVPRGSVSDGNEPGQPGPARRNR